MCFSNLPIEFDEDGNPTLADEADEVHHPDCGCDSVVDVAIDERNPQEAYDAIVESLSGDIHHRLGSDDRSPVTERPKTEGD